MVFFGELYLRAEAQRDPSGKRILYWNDWWTSPRSLTNAFFSFDPVTAATWPIRDVDPELVPGTYEPDDELDLQLTLPGEAEPLQIRARVAWTGDGGTVGLAFMDLDRRTQEHIETYVWEEVDLSDL